MRIALGSDHAGLQLKEALIAHLEVTARSYKDYGVFSPDSADYPDLAVAVAESVQCGICDCGILICGTGIGMSIAANKHKGIRAALCSEAYSARYAREHNDANILTMGSRVIGSGLAVAIIEAFFQTSFGGGRHSRRLDKITLIEAS